MNTWAVTIHNLYPSVEWRILEKKFNSFCNILPYNHQLIIDKLRTVPQLLEDEGEQLSKLISSSADTRKINEKIITYLIVKLCYSDSSASLCTIMDELIDSTDATTNLQQNSYGMLQSLITLAKGQHMLRLL